MSPSRSATAVTRAAPASSRRALACMPSSQRRLCLSQGGAGFDAFWPPDRSITCVATRPRTAPASASTAIVACPTTPVPPPLSRKFVVSCIASTCRPATRPAVPRAACSTTFSTVTFPFRRNRPMRTSPARVPPTLRTERPRGPRLTRRSCRNRPASSTRRSPKCEASLSIARRSRLPSNAGNGMNHRTRLRGIPPVNNRRRRCVHTVGPRSGTLSGPSPVAGRPRIKSGATQHTYRFSPAAAGITRISREALRAVSGASSVSCSLSAPVDGSAACALCRNFVDDMTE